MQEPQSSTASTTTTSTPTASIHRRRSTIATEIIRGLGRPDGVELGRHGCSGYRACRLSCHEGGCLLLTGSSHTTVMARWQFEGRQKGHFLINGLQQGSLVSYQISLTGKRGWWRSRQGRAEDATVVAGVIIIILRPRPCPQVRPILLLTITLMMLLIGRASARTGGQ